MFMQKYRKAFTLVELLIVICVIGILFVVLVSRVDFATDKSRQTGVQNDFHTIQTGLHLTAIANHGFSSDVNVLISQLNKNMDSEMFVSIEGGMIKTKAKDPWGSEYVLEYDEPTNTKGRVTIISAGPDTKLKTQDDIISEVVFKIENGKGNVIIDNQTQDSNNGNNEHICVFNRNVKSEQFIATRGTCTTPTLYYYSCSCGAMSATTFKGELVGHQYDSGVETTPATCTSQGRITFTCQVCSDKQYSMIPIKSHVATVDAGVSPTCLSTGLTEGKHCSACNTVLVVQQVIPANGHTLGEEADCLNAQKCTVCNADLEAALGHEYQTTVTEATCIANGKITTTCLRCGIQNVDSILAALGHSNIYPVPAGVIDIHTICSICSLTTSSEHNYDQEVQIEATCTTKGTTKYICDCGYFYIEQDIPMIEHVYGDDNKCDNCEHEKELLPGLYKTGSNYTVLLKSWEELISEGSITVSGTNLTSVIASKIKGELVIANGITNIGISLKSCGGLTSVKIPNSMTTINDEAFFYCANLVSVYLPQSISSIGKGAFKWCESLTTINLPENLTKISSYTFDSCESLINIDLPQGLLNIEPYAFQACYSLSNIVIPESVTTISEYVFRNCRALADIKLSNKTTIINDSAFSGCEKLEEISLPDSITNLGSYAFNGCKSLKTITIPPKITKISKALFSSCTNLENVIFTGNIQVIESDAFANCKSIKHIDIPQGTNYIESRAFDSCSSLKSISLPSSIIGIGYMVFDKCYNLDSVYISNLAKWCNVTISGGVNGNYAYSNPMSNGADLYLNGELVTTLTIPSGVTAIYSNVFDGCRSITTVNIPASVRNLLDHFTNCPNITSYNVDEKSPYYKSIDGNIYSKDGTQFTRYAVGKNADEFDIPLTVTSIDSSAFWGSQLKSIVLHDNIESVGVHAFDRSLKLENVVVHENLCSIRENAFDNCSDTIYSQYKNCYYLGNDENPYMMLYKVADLSITSCDIHPDTININRSAFDDCQITNLVIPASVQQIGSYAFSGCAKLETLKFENNSNLTKIAGEAFKNCKVLKNVYITNLEAWCNTSIVNANPMQYGANLYVNNELLTSLATSDITKINDYTFYGCLSLIEIVIPETVTYIGRNAFGSCSNVQNITIGRSSGWNLSPSYSETLYTQEDLGIDLSDSTSNVEYFTSTYRSYKWQIK